MRVFGSNTGKNVKFTLEQAIKSQRRGGGITLFFLLPPRWMRWVVNATPTLPYPREGQIEYSYLLTYLLTPWCIVLLEKLTGLQLVKKFPAFHGTRRVITALTSVHHLSLSWASPIQSIYPHPTSWRYIVIYSTHLRLGLPIGLFPSTAYTDGNV